MSDVATAAIAGGVFGAAATVGLQQIITYSKRPNISVDFQAVGDDKPYLHKLSLADKIPMKDGNQGGENANMALWMNLNVTNDGYSTAKNCLARLRLWKDDVEQPIWGWPVAWLRTNRLTTIENYVNIYRKDDEPLGFLILPLLEANRTTIVADRILVASIPPANIMVDQKSLVEIRIAGDNLPVKSFRFKVEWDGSIEGFKHCANRTQADG
jgi:hypothetical protein